MGHSAGDNGAPYRWDLVAPDELGSLTAGVTGPDLWFLDELVAAAGKVVARSGDGELIFVGRSLDSMFDLLGGVFADAGPPVRRLPVSFARRRRRALTPAERAAARDLLAAAGLTPYALARRTRPATFVDVASSGGTFTDLFGLVRSWIEESREPWPVIRRRMRFVGLTPRRHTSPNTDRWQQSRSWTRTLPARAVVNVSVPPGVWSYFGDHQAKLTRSHRPEHWTGDAEGPRRDDRTRAALAEAVALVAYGRSRTGRRALATAIAGEPTLAESWLRTLVTRLNA